MGNTSGRKPSHGKSNDRVYKIWSAMKSRCKNERRYIEKGIRYCKRWHKFENFYADMGDPPPATSLDRKNNALGYNKGNCRWSTKIVQNNNTSRNICPGRSIRQEAIAAGVPPTTFYSRLSSGMTIEEALDPARKKPQAAKHTTSASYKHVNTKHSLRGTKR